MLVNMNEVLRPAKKGQYAVGLFNAVNLELARGIINAAESTRSPVIMGTAEVLLPYGPLDEVSYYLLPMAKKASVPIVVHLDHGLSFDTCIKALELGFSSIMYDCSTDSYDENVRKVKEMADIAHSYGATIEGELGHVGDNEGSAEGSSHLADPSKYFTDPKLDFERIRTIAKSVDVPLVLHGGSSLTDDDFRKAIKDGISKVNIFTDINVAAVKAEFKKFSSMDKGLIDLIPAAVEAVKQETEKKLKLFSSDGKAAPAPKYDSSEIEKITKLVTAEVLKHLGK